MEQWKPIAKFNNLYQVSNTGKVKRVSDHTGFVNGHRYSIPPVELKMAIDKQGYVRGAVPIYPKLITFKIHRVVAEAFIANPENKPCVNHKDGNKQNNNVENLEWCTISENMLHAYKTNLIVAKVGSSNGMAKLTEIDVKMIRDVAARSGRYYGRKELSIKYGVSECTIKEVVSRRKNKFYNVI